MRLSSVTFLILIALSLGARISHAQTGENRPEYKFNAFGEPAFSDEKTNLKLKVSNSKDPAKVDPVKTLRNSQPYTGYVSYPRYQVGIALVPMRSGFKQEYYDLPMNFSVSSYDSTLLNARYLVNPNFYADLEYGHSSFSVQGQNSGSYQVNQSTANVESVLGRFVYCSIGTHSMNKLCYGVVTGWDAYPSLEFWSSSSLGISVVSDMVLGASFGYENIVAPFMAFTSRVEYLYGLHQGQNSSLGVDSDNKFQVEAGLNIQNNRNLNFYSFGVAYSYREAKIHGSTGTYSDTWSTFTSTFAVLMKYTWTWSKL